MCNFMIPTATWRI